MSFLEIDFFPTNIQENTLRFLDKALNFLYERHEKGESISNISSITKDLLKGVSLVLGMASEDAAHSPVPQTSMQDTEKAKVNTIHAFKILIWHKYESVNGLNPGVIS